MAFIPYFVQCDWQEIDVSIVAATAVAGWNSSFECSATGGYDFWCSLKFIKSPSPQ